MTQNDGMITLGRYVFCRHAKYPLPIAAIHLHFEQGNKNTLVEPLE